MHPYTTIPPPLPDTRRWCSKNVRLSIKSNDLLHLSRFGLLPEHLRDGVGRRHAHHAALDLVDVRVPELLLLVGQRLEQLGRDHVLDPDQACVRVRVVVDDALADI